MFACAAAFLMRVALLHHCRRLGSTRRLAFPRYHEQPISIISVSTQARHSPISMDCTAEMLQKMTPVVSLALSDLII